MFFDVSNLDALIGLGTVGLKLAQEFLSGETLKKLDHAET